jgi:hypothetical protein
MGKLSRVQSHFTANRKQRRRKAMSVSAAHVEKAAFENLRNYVLELYENPDSDEVLDIFYLIDVIEESVALSKEGLVRELMAEVIEEVEKAFTDLLTQGEDA